MSKTGDFFSIGDGVTGKPGTPTSVMFLGVVTRTRGEDISVLWADGVVGTYKDTELIKTGRRISHVDFTLLGLIFNAGEKQ